MKRIICLTTAAYIASFTFGLQSLHAGFAKSSPSAPVKPSRVIISIGVNSYKHLEGFQDLIYAANDANEVSRYLSLSEKNRYAKSKVIVLTERNAVKGNILNSIASFAGGTDKKTTELYLYFAGHTNESAHGIDLIPFVPKKTDAVSVLSSAELASAIAKADPARLILMIDANCSVQIMDAVAAVYKGEIIAIGAGTKDSPVLESAEWKHGALSKEIIDAFIPLAGKEQTIEWKELFPVLEKRVKALTKKMQSPALLYNGSRR